MKVYPAAALAGAPETFKSVDAGKLTSKFGEKVTVTYDPTRGKVNRDSADKSDTVSFAKNAVSKELGENRAGAHLLLFAIAPFTVTAETDTIRIINFLKFETGGIHV